MNPLTSAERRALRARAHPLNPVVSVGQHGLTPAVLHEIDVALLAHELIKIRVWNDDRAARASLSERICSELGAAPVQHIGKLLVVWRPAPPPEPAAPAPAARRKAGTPKPSARPARGKAAPGAGAARPAPRGAPRARSGPGTWAAKPAARPPRGAVSPDGAAAGARRRAAAGPAAVPTQRRRRTR